MWAALGRAAVASGQIVQAGGQSRGRRVAAPSRRNTAIQRQGCLAPPAGVPLPGILYIKELVGRFGAEPMHTFIDAFAK